jgi:DNA anti-recombination protein RmuC
MAIGEEARHHLYQRLEEVLGPTQAATLMEHLPPAGWADVATKHDLEALATKRDLEALAAGLRQEIGQVRHELALFEARWVLRFEQSEARLGELDARWQSRFEQSEARTEARLDELDARWQSRFEQSEARTEARFNELDARTEARSNRLEARWQSRLHEEFRAQTWRLITAMLAFASVIVAAIRL